MSDADLVLPFAKDCKHPKCAPTFDEEAAKAVRAGCQHKPASSNAAVAFLMGCLSCTEEIRKRWPRFWGKCPDCGAQVIAYASDAHFIYGDW